MLHLAGFTPRELHPSEQSVLLEFGLGVTNLVPRPTARADELADSELRLGAAQFEQKLQRHRPRWAAVLGLTAYRVAFGRPAAVVGEQADRVGSTRLWVLPNPSGLNAHYQLPALANVFAELRRAVFG